MEFPILFLIVLLFIIGLIVLNIFTSVWAYRDAKKKSNSELYCLVVLVGTLIFPVVGLLVYIIIRND
ncbi:hypothetical protein E4663_08920 [Halobacillus salinus]|uniref:Cardiolipin synthase N-terminal domain-containing protein n=1 Tax=Halobacillus salinus TaxID=192814 RepID=A0A4Z0H711_9BACI|nr:hypothetical protein E4663_08920 [Halobacillus salinus]